MSSLKIKIIICCALIITILLLIICCRNKKSTLKENTFTSKEIKESIIISQINKNLSVKPKIIKTIKSTKTLINNAVKNKPDTVYTAFADTVLSFNDSLGNTMGVLNISTSYLSNKILSDSSLFIYKINLINFTKEKLIKEVKETKLFNNTKDESKFGLGLFGGGVITADKKITYGIGIGIYYKLIY